MTRYSTETVDMFEGQSLDRPRILPRAGDTLDMFDSQPRAAQEAPAAPEPIQGTIDGPLVNAFGTELPDALLEELAAAPGELTPGLVDRPATITWRVEKKLSDQDGFSASTIDAPAGIYLRAAKYGEHWAITAEGTFHGRTTGGYGGSCMSAARVERFARLIVSRATQRSLL